MKLFYTDHFELPLPPGHRFPMAKYRRLTEQGLASRDSLVISELRTRMIPTAIAMAGGYANSIDDIVDIHAQTIRIVSESFRRNIR